jgi:DNA polymerase III alpha subunit
MKLPANFTHLHVHSHYSLMGATPTLPELVSLARQGRAESFGAYGHKCLIWCGCLRP